MPTAPTRSRRRELMFALIQTARHVRTHVDQVARAHGTTRAQWGLLSRLKRAEGLSQADLAEEMELTPISVGRLVDRLAEQGLIERRADRHDRRVNRLHLTAAGRAMVDGLDVLREDIAAEVFAGVADADVETCLAVLAVTGDRIRHPLGHGTELPADLDDGAEIAVRRKA